MENKIQIARRYCCDYGHRHRVTEECNHRNEYRIFPIEFRTMLFKMFGDKYNEDITDRMRNETMAKCNRF